MPFFVGRSYPFLLITCPSIKDRIEHINNYESITVSGKLLTHPSLGLRMGLELTQILWRGGRVIYEKPELIRVLDKKA